MTAWLVSAGQRACLLFAIFLIAGCASFTRPGAENSAKQAIWEGRLLVQVEGSTPQSLSASFTLQGNVDVGSLVLYTPLGTTAAQLTWDTSGARLQTHDQTHQAATLAELTRHLTGTDLPIASLFDWLQGLNSPAPGWTVDLSQWSQGRLHAQRQSPDAPAQLRLILER